MEGHWTMRDGTQIRYVDMAPRNLRRGSRMLRRIVEKEIQFCLRMLPLVQGLPSASELKARLKIMEDGLDRRSKLADQMDQLANEKERK